MKVCRKNSTGGYTLLFRCPGCDDLHSVNQKWDWNGNKEAPTLSPSVLVTYKSEGEIVAICHSFVVDGKFQYLSDCTHKLAGQTVEIPNWDSYLGENEEDAL